MSEVATQTMSEREARRLTERIRIAAVNFVESRDKLMTLVQEAKEGNAHLALDYKSWQAYLTDTLGDEPMHIARSEGRPEMVQWLTDQDMSTRAVAVVVGISEGTVRNDLSSTAQDYAVAEPRISHGLDGKVRVHQPRPKPTDEQWQAYADDMAAAKTKRPPLPDQFFNTIYDLTRNMDRLKKLTEDDRYPANKEKVALKHESDLQRLAATLAEVLQTMNNN